jgi:Protein of unknown function (DUF1376)
VTEPLTPPDCDLRGLGFMPLDVGRLRDSDLALVSSGEEFKAAVLLWCASWHQVPAASLPDDDRALCRLAGVEPKVWQRVRDGALRGWIQCDDGRLYHPVVAEKALDACQRRQVHRRRRDVDRQRLQNWREKKRSAGDVEAAPETLAETQDETRFETRRTGTGTGTGTVSSVPTGTGASPLVDDEDVLAEIRSLPRAKGCWRLGVRLLTERGGFTEGKARTFIGRMKANGLSDADLWSIGESAWQLGTLDPAAYLAKAADEAAARKGSGAPITAPSERQQRAWMQDWRERGAVGWRVHERGPRPGEVGCRVSAPILAEFGLIGSTVVPLNRAGAAA